MSPLNVSYIFKDYARIPIGPLFVNRIREATIQTFLKSETILSNPKGRCNFSKEGSQSDGIAQNGVL